jgi:dTDP-4-dehydrorhamnose reductase
MVHYSTDYVFDGSGDAPWRETDTSAPLNVYGRSKWEGEQAIQHSGCKHLIFRTSWVYAARGGNFAKTMLRLAQEREELKVIDDQWGAPTGADLLADVTAHALRAVTGAGSSASPRPELQGLYHLAASGVTTWCGYAKTVIDQSALVQPTLKITAKKISPIPTSAYPTPAQRPHNSRLNTAKLQHAFGLSLPHWQMGVERMVREIL